MDTNYYTGENFVFRIEFSNALFLCISDQCEVRGHEAYKSLTNSAQAVVKYLDERHSLGKRRILYKDTIGNWDEIEHNQGEFTGFKSLGAKTLPWAFKQLIMKGEL